MRCAPSTVRLDGDLKSFKMGIWMYATALPLHCESERRFCCALNGLQPAEVEQILLQVREPLRICNILQLLSVTIFLLRASMALAAAPKYSSL